MWALRPILVTQMSISLTQPVVGIREIRIDLDSPLIFGYCFGVLPLAGVKVSKLKVGLGQ